MARVTSAAAPARVLVAEPDADERARLVEVIRRAAKAIGHRVVIDQASDGTTAMAMWGEHMPRLVVCEVLLEGLSGLALLRRMQTDRGSVPPVIFVTRMSRESDRYWGLRNGAHSYLAKPYDDEMLQARVQDVLDKGPQAPRDPVLG